MTESTRAIVYRMLSGDDDGRVCRDIPESACKEQPGNFLKHVASLTATKTGGGLADPKLVLSWLLDHLGASTIAIGWLVPVREAGALLPQLVTAGWIRALRRRKWAWVAGSLVQGLAVLGMAGAGLALEGAAAGWTVVALLAVFSLARSVCSVSYKDVLGKTVAKSTRGAATGAAGSLSAALVLLYGAALGLGLLDTTVPVVTAFLAVAGVLWLLAAALFATVVEHPGATAGGGNALRVAVEQIDLLRRDRQLVLFIVTRGLLTATALAPPYLFALGKQESGGLGRLGPFVIASSVAALTSALVWGRLADRSSRRVLVTAGALAALTLALTAALAVADAPGLDGPYLLPTLLFVLMIAYQGVRLGRSTHIVDMADESTRASYTALSNTAIGILLLAAGSVGALAQEFGAWAVLALFAAMSATASLTATLLDEVQ